MTKYLLALSYSGASAGYANMVLIVIGPACKILSGFTMFSRIKSNVVGTTYEGLSNATM